MAKKTIKYADLMKMAETYGVENNALFVAAAEQYDFQMDVIRQVKDALNADDRMTVTKEYVKGRETLTANPLIVNLPKLTDSANKTLTVMMDIIVKLGTKKEQIKRFGELGDE